MHAGCLAMLQLHRPTKSKVLKATCSTWLCADQHTLNLKHLTAQSAHLAKMLTATREHDIHDHWRMLNGMR